MEMEVIMKIIKNSIISLIFSVTAIALPAQGMFRTLNLLGVIKIVRINAHDIKTEGIATWMKVANMLVPCILIIDDIDFLNLKRTQSCNLLLDFLKELNSISLTKPVIIIGSATKIENIDSAIRQHAKVLSYDYSGSRMFFIINGSQMAGLNMRVNLHGR